MKTDRRLARMLHVLVHMGRSGKRETSETIAAMLNTHSPVVRRTMAALRIGKIVQSEGGRCGGWKLARNLSEITVLEVQKALDRGSIIRVPLSKDTPESPVERATNSFLEYAYAQAEQELEARFGNMTLCQLFLDAEKPVEKSAS